MKSKKLLLENLSDQQKESIQKLDLEGLKRIFQSREVAVEYAKKGILQSQPGKLNKEYIELVADSMQVLARIVLEERGILKKS